MDQADHLPRRPDAVVHVPVDKHLPPALPAHVRRHLLEFTARAFPLDPHCVLGDFVPEQPARVPPPPQHELRVRFLRVHDGGFDVVVDRRLDRAHEPRAHVDPLRAQRQGRSEALPVREAARGDEGHRQALPRPA